MNFVERGDELVKRYADWRAFDLADLSYPELLDYRAALAQKIEAISIQLEQPQAEGSWSGGGGEWRSRAKIARSVFAAKLSVVEGLLKDWE